MLPLRHPQAKEHPRVKLFSGRVPRPLKVDVKLQSGAQAVNIARSPDVATDEDEVRSTAKTKEGDEARHVNCDKDDRQSSVCSRGVGRG